MTLAKSPNTGMAVTIDIGDSADIHPKDKQDVGKRLGAVRGEDRLRQNHDRRRRPDVRVKFDRR